MFKKCKENQCLNREMLDFFARQLNLLKEVARACPATHPDITADQIRDAVELMEKRIIFVLDQKPAEEFHDYVSDFYEDKLQKLRRELGKEMGRCKQAEGKVEELVRQLRGKEEVWARGKPVDFAAVSQNVALRNELAHSQELIAHNQEVMEDQHRALEDLQAYVTKLEERERQLQARTQLKIRELDEAITAKHKAILSLTREFQRQSKKREKEWRQLQLLNVGMLEEKDRLESELVIKSEEIKLLAKKAYDQSLVIGKFERAIDQSEGVLLEEKIENNRVFDHNKQLRERMRLQEEEYELKLAQKAREFKEVQNRLLAFTNSNRELELAYNKSLANAERLASELKAKTEEGKRVEEETAGTVQKFNEKQRERKRLELKAKQSEQRAEDAEQLLREKEGELLRAKETLQQLRRDYDNLGKLHEREKHGIKTDIEAQLQRLIDLNQDALGSLQAREKELAAVTANYEQAVLKNREAAAQLCAFQESFQDAKGKMGRVEEQRRDLDYVREQLELKLKHTERRCEELLRGQEEKESLSRKYIELEETQQQSRKLLKEKENELEKCRKIAQEEGKRRTSGDLQEARLLREEMAKKDFRIRELLAKVKELQEQLRDTARNHQIERQNMGGRIKELEQIINEQSDRAHRMDSSIS